MRAWAVRNVEHASHRGTTAHDPHRLKRRRSSPVDLSGVVGRRMRGRWCLCGSGGAQHCDRSGRCKNPSHCRSQVGFTRPNRKAGRLYTRRYTPRDGSKSLRPHCLLHCRWHGRRVEHALRTRHKPVIVEDERGPAAVRRSVRSRTSGFLKVALVSLVKVQRAVLDPPPLRRLHIHVVVDTGGAMSP